MCDDLTVNSSCDLDEDVPTLPADTLAILQEFYQEQNESFKKEQQGEIGENWGLSQFWYDDRTATILAKEVLEASNNGRICCLCAPTLYKKLRELKPESCEIYLFEYDKRFAIFGNDFVFYDYNEPLKIPDHIPEKSFDVVFADPPFLNEDCVVKITKTVRYLTKDKVIFITGLQLQDVVVQLFGAKLCRFIPQHENNLMNALRCYTNYDSTLDTIE